MAAVLKKRVVAELCQVAQTLAPPAKKFRSSSFPNAPVSLNLDLNKCKTHKDVLHALSTLTESFPVDMDRVGPLINHLISYFQLETDSVIKVKIMEVLRILIQYPSCNSAALCHDLVELLECENSSDVMAEIVVALKTIGFLNISDQQLLSTIINCSLEVIKDDNDFVRSKCLELIGQLGSHDMVTPANSQSNSNLLLKDILFAYTDDPDWRVRLSALEAVLLWHHRGLLLDWSLYERAVPLLDDNQEKVRLAVTKLLWVIAQMNPEIIVNSPDGGDRMVDDCFVNLCEVMTDISSDVKAQAAKLLGSMHEVSLPVLYQTLEKKLMSNYRKKVSAHERQKEMYMSGEWAVGKVSNDAPREKLDPGNMTIVSRGACGAFVNGLEDEFSKVRNASLDSLCELSCQHPDFAQQSQDFAVDMLTDEIDSVRLNAINSLHKMSRLLFIRDDQLELILGVLKDYYAYMREATHRLLSSCSLSATSGVNMAVKSLLQNLSLYPEDKLSIWRTMKSMGKNNSSLVFAILPSLLGLHHFFDTKENELGDPAYIALMILASNASPNCSAMTGTLPSFIFNHFTHLKNVYPDLIPDIWFAHEKEMNALKADEKRSMFVSPSSNQKKFLNVVLSQLDKVNFMRDIPSAYKLLQIACRDLSKVDELAPEMSASAKYVMWHLKCQMKISEILSRNQFSFTTKSPESLGQQIQKLRRTLMFMKTIFVGINNIQLIEINQLLLVVSALQLLFAFPSTKQFEKKSGCFRFSNQVMKLTDLLAGANLPTSRMVSRLTTELNFPQNGDTTNYHRLLVSALRVHSSTPPVLPKLNNQLLMMKATILEPNRSDFVYTVVPKYILPIRMVVELENIENIERIRIHVKYANQREYLSKPDSSNFNTINSMRHKLSTQVMLSDGLWSEPCQVQLRVVYLSANADDDDDLPDHIISLINDKTCSSTSLSSWVDYYIELSEVVTATIHPSAQKDSLFLGNSK